MNEQAILLDLRGLKCPLPALFAKRALGRASPGTVVEVVADDPLAGLDIPHMCAQEGYDVESTMREGTLTRMVLRKPAIQGKPAVQPPPA